MLTNFFNKNLQTSQVFSNVNENSKYIIYNSLTELEASIWQYYSYMVESVHLVKDDMLIEQGQIPEYLYFLMDGGFAKRFMNKNGNELPLGIINPYEFACPLYNFTAKKPALFSIKMDSDATVLRISYNNYMCLKSLSPIIDQLEDIISKCSFNNLFRSPLYLG